MPDRPPPDVGAMRHRVTWQTSTMAATPTSAGQKVKTWSSAGTYWADCRPLSGTELYNARQLKATSSYRIAMRNVGPVKPGDQLLFEATGRAFAVDSVFREQERNAYLTIHATELIDPK